MTAAQQMLDQARASTAGCTQTSEVLVRILCAKQLRVGLRSYYPGFSVRDQSNAFSGFEVDIARRIADFLGVRLVPVVVDTKTRIPLVADGDIDLVIDQPEQLLDALEFNECAFVMHDNTFFAEALMRPNWANRFAVKFGFAPIPWGMAVARSGAKQFAALLDELSVAFHVDGVFLRLARDHGLDDVFLLEEQSRWALPRCIAADGMVEANCLIPPVDTSDANDVSMMAAQAAWLEKAATNWLGLRLDLSPLKHQSAIGLLLEGVGYSLALVVGVVLTTTAFALSLAWLMTHGPTAMRLGVAGLAAIGQTSPLPLLLFFGFVVAGGVTQYSGFVALGAAVVVIGFYNGTNAAQAIKDAHQAVQGRSFLSAVSAAGIQLFAFLINATKGSPAAGMIGVPEFLNVTTDLTAYSRDRVAVYLLLLLFYTGLVLAVIALLSRLETWLGNFVRRSS